MYGRVYSQIDDRDRRRRDPCMLLSSVCCVLPVYVLLLLCVLPVCCLCVPPCRLCVN